MPKTGKTQRQPEMVSGVGYCRKCQKTMDLSKFYPTTNLFLDSNGYLSICKECSNNIYDHYFSIYGNMEQALQLTCQDLDVRFSKETVKQVQSQVDKLLSQGKKASAIFGFYKSKLGSTGKNNEGLDSFRYKDRDFVDKKELATFNPINNDDEDEIDEDLEIFWGKGFAIDDLIFLESELTNWKKTHKCDNQAEITLLKEICIKILIIRNKRALGENTSSDLKELQDLMKTASVDPAKANAASAGKSLDSFGIWVKDIEQLRPAEWYEQQEKYKDMDGFVPYIKNYIVRPIENFLTGVRNFVVNDNIDADLDSADIGISDGDTNG